jgi:hypothetical protein
MIEQKFDVDIYNLDWANFSIEARQKLTLKHISHISSIKRLIASIAMHKADIRNLFTMMMLTLVLNIMDVGQKTTIMVMIATQLLLSIFSRLTVNSMAFDAQSSKKELLDYLEDAHKYDNV